MDSAPVQLITPHSALITDPALPGAADIQLLKEQYTRAVDGLYEAYRFGHMLLKVKAALESFTGNDTRVNAREGANGGTLSAGGWNAGTGLKGWLTENCPEIHYRTAMRFAEIAASTQSALRHQDQRDTLPEGWEPEEAAVRDWLSGKSQRAVLRLGGKREGAGRKPKNYAAALGASPEIAWKELELPLQQLSELIAVQKRHTVLTDLDRRTLLDSLRLLIQTIEG